IRYLSYLIHYIATTLFDWFLFIVKPHLHKRFMKPWVALTLTITLVYGYCLLYLAVHGPFIGLNEYVYDEQLLVCYQCSNNMISVSISVFLLCVTTAIIIVTSLLTFCFTRNYFKAQSVIAGESVYASKKEATLWSIWKHVISLWDLCCNLMYLLNFIILVRYISFLSQ
uniref:Uncharacterized protein n=1 Tax=Amphimedon queenslandica TaxID=400682 RepID=A0A1X7T7E6_AMPQE